MEIFSALLAICAGNSPVPGEFPAQRPVTWSFDVSFDLCLDKRLSKQSWGWWFETLSCPLWRHCNGSLSTDGVHGNAFQRASDLNTLQMSLYVFIDDTNIYRVCPYLSGIPHRSQCRWNIMINLGTLTTWITTSALLSKPKPCTYPVRCGICLWCSVDAIHRLICNVRSSSQLIYQRDLPTRGENLLISSSYSPWRKTIYCNINASWRLGFNWWLRSTSTKVQYWKNSYV